MRKNKKLKKELLLYSKEVIFNLNEFVNKNSNEKILIDLIGDVSLTNELVSTLKTINYMEKLIDYALEFPIGSEYIGFDIKEYFNARNYYEELLKQTINQKYNAKKYIICKKQL